MLVALWVGHMDWGFGIASTIIGLLIGLGWFVVRPATRTIRAQVDELETRVAVRTAALATASEMPSSALAPRFDLFGVPSSRISVSSTLT